MVYQRLCGVEKAKQVALIACIRKLLTTLNTMLTDRARWRTEQLQHAGQLRLLLPKSLAVAYFLRADMESHYRLTQERLDPVAGEGGRRWAPTRIRIMTKCSLDCCVAPKPSCHQGAGFSPGTLSKPSREEGRARTRGGNAERTLLAKCQCVKQTGGQLLDPTIVHERDRQDALPTHAFVQGRCVVMDR